MAGRGQPQSQVPKYCGRKSSEDLKEDQMFLLSTQMVKIGGWLGARYFVDWKGQSFLRFYRLQAGTSV